MSKLMDKFWMVVGVAEEDTVDGVLLMGHVPRKMHDDKAVAEEEALYLGRHNREKEFFVLEAVSKSVPTQSRPDVYRLEPVRETD